MSVAIVGGVLTDSHANGLLATQSIAISPVSPVYAYDHHQQHQQQHHHHHLGATAVPRHVDFIRSSPSMMPVVEPAIGSPVDDGRVPSYAQPTALDGFCSAASTMPAPVCTPLVGVGVSGDDRPPSNSALQLMDYVTPRAADCGPYGHLPARADIYRSMSVAPGDPFAAVDMYRAFSVPSLKSELV